MFGNNVSAYSIGAGGGLMTMTSLGSPFAAGTGPVSVAGDPTAKFAYVANVGDSNVSASSSGANGALPRLTSSGSPFAAGTEPASVAVNPTGKFAYVANTGFPIPPNASVSAYSIGANGAPTPVPGAPFAAGTFSPPLARAPPAQFASLADQFTNTLHP